MDTIRVDLRTVRELHENLLSAQEESEGWRAAIDAAKATLEGLLNEFNDQYPPVFTLSEVAISTNGLVGGQELLELELHKEHEPDVLMATLAMTPSEAKSLVESLQELLP